MGCGTCCVRLSGTAQGAAALVQAIVGHADLHVRMTIYAHACLEDQRKALDQLAELVAGQTLRS